MMRLFLAYGKNKINIVPSNNETNVMYPPPPRTSQKARHNSRTTRRGMARKHRFAVR